MQWAVEHTDTEYAEVTERGAVILAGEGAEESVRVSGWWTRSSSHMFFPLPTHHSPAFLSPLRPLRLKTNRTPAVSFRDFRVFRGYPNPPRYSMTRPIVVKYPHP